MLVIDAYNLIINNNIVPSVNSTVYFTYSNHDVLVCINKNEWDDLDYDFINDISQSTDRIIVRDLYYNHNKDYIIEKIKEFKDTSELQIPETFDCKSIMKFLSNCKAKDNNTCDKIKHLSLIYSALNVMYKIKPNIELIVDKICCDYCSQICGLNCCCSDHEYFSDDNNFD